MFYDWLSVMEDVHLPRKSFSLDFVSFIGETIGAMTLDIVKTVLKHFLFINLRCDLLSRYRSVLDVQL